VLWSEVEAFVTDTRVMLRPRDITRDYGIPKTVIYRLTASGEIPKAQIGRGVYIWREDLERYLKGQTD
jgi:excisionase family DNA binding protein